MSKLWRPKEHMLCVVQVMTSPNSDVAFKLTWVELKNRQSCDLPSWFKICCKTPTESINLGATLYISQ